MRKKFGKVYIAKIERMFYNCECSKKKGATG